MADAIGTLQRGFLTEKQIEASRLVMGLDTQLVTDGTYYIVERAGMLAGCGGWSRRATLFGGDHTAGRDAAALDPAHHAARIRAMYTAPALARQGVGRTVLRACEGAALAAGFATAELAATRAGLPLYTASGYVVVEHFEALQGVVGVPLTRMRKQLG